MLQSYSEILYIILSLLKYLHELTSKYIPKHSKELIYNTPEINGFLSGTELM
jgi:hypothetical protein